MDKPYIMLDMDQDKVKNKNYDLKAFALTTVQGKIDKDKNKRIIPKAELEGSFKQILKLTNYKCKVVIKTFIELGILEEDQDNYYLNPVTSSFLKLFVPTARYCLNNLSSFSFKIYCYLLNKQAIHDRYNHFENYFFSKTELLEIAGYAKNQNNMLLINQTLNTLERLSLIEYNHECVGRPGKHGRYYELYHVSQVSNAQTDAANDFIKEHDVIEAGMLEDIALPGVKIPVEKLPDPQYVKLLEKFYIDNKDIL